MNLTSHPLISQFLAYDNTQRKVLEVVILDITTGAFEKSMEFQVIDILALFNLLLGRP